MNQHFCSPNMFLWQCLKARLHRWNCLVLSFLGWHHFWFATKEWWSDQHIQPGPSKTSKKSCLFIFLWYFVILGKFIWKLIWKLKNSLSVSWNWSSQRVWRAERSWDFTYIVGYRFTALLAVNCQFECEHCWKVRHESCWTAIFF